MNATFTPPLLLGLMRPLPVHYIWTIDAMLVGIGCASNLLIFKHLFHMSTSNFKFWNSIDYIDRDAETVNLILNCQIKRRVNIPLLLIATHMDVVMVCTAVGESMDQPGVAVEVEDNRFVGGKQTVKVKVT